MQFSTFDGWGFQLGGFSLGGIETSVIVPEWRLAVDVGRGRREALRCEHLALTHTHMDHAGGLAYVLSTRQLLGMGPPRVYVPASMADALREMIGAWERLQRFEMAYDLIPVEPGEEYPLRGGRFLIPFRTRHVIPSVGYRVVERVEKLLDELHGLPGPEIARRRKEGAKVTRTVDHRLLAITGDTLPEVLDDGLDLMDYRVVVHECTFLNADKPYEACRDGGHTHLQDLLERADGLTCEHLVLSHFSQIHRWGDIPSLLSPLVERTSARVYAFPMDPDSEIVGPLGSSHPQTPPVP